MDHETCGICCLPISDEQDEFCYDVEDVDGMIFYVPVHPDCSADGAA